MKEIKVSINSILLDVENPRIDPVRAQEDAIKELMETVGDNKLFSLAADIMQNGMNPSDIPMCVEYLTDKGKKVYIAKEGNRRLLALKGITKPRIFNNAKWRSRMERLIYKAGGIGQAPKKVRIQVYADDERAVMDHWIEIKHNGENGGAGTVPWGSPEKTRFFDRGKNANVTMAIMDWLKGDASISSEDREKLKAVPITTLERIVSSVPGRTIIGIEMRDGHLRALRNLEHVKNDVLSIISDLTTASPTNPRKKTINVSDVKNTRQIENYLSQKFPKRSEEDRLPVPVQINTSDIKSGGFVNGSGDRGNRHLSSGSSIGGPTHLRRRLRLVKDVASNDKIKKLVEELCALNVKSVPLAFCIVFRSLLDVSMTNYARKNGIPTGNAQGAVTSFKTLAVECKKKIISKQEWSTGAPLNWINDAVARLTGDNLFSITELNNLVHGTMQIPSVDIILTYSPRIIPFLIALNGGNPPEEG